MRPLSSEVLPAPFVLASGGPASWKWKHTEWIDGKEEQMKDTESQEVTLCFGLVYAYECVSSY